MTREEKIAKARELREQGMKPREIALELGVDRSTVWKWANPQQAADIRRRDNASRASAKRAWENEHDRGTCTRCGGAMGVGAVRKGQKLCRPCWLESEHQRMAERYAFVARLWNEGKSHREIAAAMGWECDNAGPLVDAARAAGYDLPYRHHGAVKGQKFPKQVAA